MVFVAWIQSIAVDALYADPNVRAELDRYGVYERARFE